ncbi:MAG: molecular chaperone DnaJ [Cytophagaceae bacterium]|jgi:tetratricopeptide (TPR) repeat protein|nr:molecular chaperone DnaJ [Cytophagaceae bacterium]
MKTTLLMRFVFLGLFYTLAQFHSTAVPYDSLVIRQYQQAKDWMLVGQYDSAHAAFKRLFALQLTIPDEAAYYYGVNQFQRKKYKQAKQGFEKYLKLRGDSAVWSDSSFVFIERVDCIERGYIEVKDTCGWCKGSGHVKGKCYTCKGIGKLYCSVCQGKGVVVTGGNMSQNYQACYKCSGTGIVLCSTCNGSTYAHGECPTCKGNGIALKRKPCPGTP